VGFCSGARRGCGAPGVDHSKPARDEHGPDVSGVRPDDCSRFDRVGARVRAVKTKVAIYVDTLAPAGGLDSLALDSIANTFDQRLYAIDTAAFGRESDIDSNTVVLVLMTNTVNKLVTASECNASGGAFVAGFFFARTSILRSQRSAL